MVIITALLSVLLAGSLVYCLLVMVAARHYLGAALPPSGAAWPVVVLALGLRAGAAVATSVFVVRDPLFRRHCWLLPLQDALGFMVWIGGFLGETVVWRDRKCTVLRDGRLEVN
jgi:hypothetical protein